MKKLLVLSEVRVWHYDENGTRVEGLHKDIWGDVYGIWGDVSGLKGDVSGIRGDVSGTLGDVSGILGDVSGIRGNVDECEITNEERQAGINILDLVLEKE